MSTTAKLFAVFLIGALMIAWGISTHTGGAVVLGTILACRAVLGMRI